MRIFINATSFGGVLCHEKNLETEMVLAAGRHSRRGPDRAADARHLGARLREPQTRRRRIRPRADGRNQFHQQQEAIENARRRDRHGRPPAPHRKRALQCPIFDPAHDSDNPIDFVWQGIVGGLTRIIRNHPKDRFVTRVPLAGNFDDPTPDVMTTIVNVFKNAFIKAFERKLENENIELPKVDKEKH
jgi:hypothetical protein